MFAVSSSSRECSVSNKAKEFLTGQGEQCAIMVGFAHEQREFAGVVYRPINDGGWACGAASIDYRDARLAPKRRPSVNAMATTNGAIRSRSRVSDFMR